MTDWAYTSETGGMGLLAGEGISGVQPYTSCNQSLYTVKIIVKETSTGLSTPLDTPFEILETVVT